MKRLKKFTIKIVAILMVIASTITGVTATEDDSNKEQKANLPRSNMSLLIDPKDEIKSQGIVSLTVGLTASQGEVEDGANLIVKVPKNIVGPSGFQVEYQNEIFLDGWDVAQSDATNYVFTFKNFKTPENGGYVTTVIYWTAPTHHEGNANVPTDATFSAEFIYEGGDPLKAEETVPYKPLKPASLPVFAKWTTAGKKNVYDFADEAKVHENVAQIFRGSVEATKQNIFQLPINYVGGYLGKVKVEDTLPANTQFVDPNTDQGAGYWATDKTIFNHARVLRATEFDSDDWPIKWENVTKDFKDGNSEGNSIKIEKTTNSDGEEIQRLEVVFGDPVENEDTYVVEYGVAIDDNISIPDYGVRKNAAKMTYGDQDTELLTSHAMGIGEFNATSLQISKSASENYILGSKYIDYTIYIKNHDTKSISIPRGSSIVDPLASTLTYVDGSATYTDGYINKTSYVNNTLSWDLEKELKAGEDLTIKFKVKVDDTDNSIDIGKTVNNTANLKRKGYPVISVNSKTAIVGTGKVQINKTIEGSGGKPLQNAEFGLYNATDTEFKNPVSKGTTDENGILVFNDVLVGNYKVKEIKAPTGYYLNDTVKDVIINKGSILSNNGIVEVDFENKEITTGGVRVTKVDSDSKEGLADAEFKLIKGKETSKEYYISKDNWGDSKDAQVFKTNDKGLISIDELEYGEYTLEETKAPNGYEIINKYTSFYVQKNAIVTVPIENRLITEGNLNVTKVDSETGDTLEGAEFILSKGQAPLKEYYSNGTWVADKTQAEVFTTDANGQFSITGLEQGKYTLEETKAPEGYEVTDEFTQVTIVKNSSVGVTIKNKEIDTGNLSIVKVDKDDHKVTLAGAEFILSKEEDSKTLYYNNGTWTEDKTAASVLVTDENGSCQVDDLAYGTYSLIEIKAPEGYELGDNNSYLVTIADAENTIEIENKKRTETPTTPEEPEDEGEVLGETHETGKDVIKTSDTTNLISLSLLMVMSGIVMFSFKKKKENY